MRIQVLSPIIAERIAAGEVIERPASVVKELVENSLDAGATEIAVILEGGGTNLIEVLDNGHGMGVEDLALCVQRHATSKLRDLEDLGTLRTLGFRGEALPSVAAVSDLQILSREKRGSSDAYELLAGASPQKVTFGHFLGSAHGTQIRARGLFSQIPARLKFLKSQGTEVAHTREWLERLALSHPEVGFRLVSDDRTVLNLRPQDEGSRVRAILAEGEDYPIVTASEGSMRVHWVQGMSTPQTRRLIQVVNGRAVRDRVLQQALLGPFKQALLPGQFPAVALFVEADPRTLDINVHPTKTEIRFLESRKIFQQVSSLIESMINQNGAPAFAAGASGINHSYVWRVSEKPVVMAEQVSLAIPQTEIPHMTQVRKEHPLQAGRFVGILFNTYFIYEIGDELGLVDQHSAHERIRYEELRHRVFGDGQKRALSAQALLVPEVVPFEAEKRLILEKRLSGMEKMGFDSEIFGEKALLIRSIPMEWGTENLTIRLKNLVDRLTFYESKDSTQELMMDEALFEVLASEACHSAVRAGDRLTEFEVNALLERLFACEHPWNCPHGRPTVVRVPQARFEQWFQRRV